jgi:hypothetical protein
MDLVPVIFWLGMGLLLVSALVLRGVATEVVTGLAVAPGAVGTPVQTIRRGRVRLAIWRSQDRGGAAGRHCVSVDRRGPDCGDCIDCMNLALRWIREHEANA